MDFSSLIQSLSDDTVRSLRLYSPELTLCATILVLLLTRVFRMERVLTPLLVSLVGVVAAAAAQLSLPQELIETAIKESGRAPEMFTGMLIYDDMTAFFRLFLIAFAFLFLILTQVTGVPDRDAATDVYTLVLGAIVGMCLMASANHLLTVFLAVEMASVPSYALAGLLKGRRQSSEAALKYVIYGAGAAGVMLYGTSLLAGILGTCHLPTMARQLAAMDLSVASGEVMALALGALMLMVGLAFKLSAVPFHFWCPDVFEGATAEVNAFLSVASKGAALALLVRVAFGLGHIPGGESRVAELPVRAIKAEAEGVVRLVAVAPEKKQAAAGSTEDALAPVRGFMARMIALIAIITCTFGNLAAYGQTNIKRMLAYSTIAHAGYMMMPVAAALVLMGRPADAPLAERAVASILFYVAVYLFMNLGAFAVVAILRNKLRSEQIADYAGLVRRAPTIVVCFAIILFSLVGLPPLAGFAGKFLIFFSLKDADWIGWTLLVVAAVNTVLSLFYYLRVIKVMTIDPEPEDRVPVDFSPVAAETVYVLGITIPVVVFGILFGGLLSLARDAAARLLS